MQCSYENCDGKLDQSYERPKGRWWARCLKCERANRLTVSYGKDGAIFAHPSPVGPPPDDLVMWSGYVRKDQRDWLKRQPNGSELVRSGIDKIIKSVKTYQYISV